MTHIHTVANINGYETPIDLELPETSHVSGDFHNFEIVNGNVRTIGGVANVKFSVATTEAVKDIELPFSRLLDFQATAMDVGGDFGESCHIQRIVGTENIRLYARTKTPFKGELPIKWAAVGI